MMKKKTANRIQIYLTKGLFGEKIDEISSLTLSKNDNMLEKIWKSIHAFKDKKSNKKKYKIEIYDRILQNPDDDTEVAIDFGDYNTFLLVKGIPPHLFF